MRGEAATRSKVVWIRRGNCSTQQIEQMLRGHADDVRTLATNGNFSYFDLAKPLFSSEHLQPEVAAETEYQRAADAWWIHPSKGCLRDRIVM